MKNRVYKIIVFILCVPAYGISAVARGLTKVCDAWAERMRKINPDQ